VAILLVLLTHTRTPGFETAGAVGVTMFFTLSGFLITSLLLEERATTGRIGLVDFYLRGARRLFPALAVVVAVVAVFRLFAPGTVVVPILLGSVTYSTNWVLAGGAYGFGGRALTHT
jgi:peptidoglycan/LPS O-acetylase OafA/YrhL